MFESIVDAVSGSDWSYLIVFVIAMLDAFFPVVPSEATAIAAGVVAGTGGLSVELVILAAALGAIAGDNICFIGGHFLGERLNQRFFQGEKGKKRVAWARKMLDERGGYIIVVARFIPGGRTVTTFTAGFVDGMPWRRFIRYDVIAGADLGHLHGDARLHRRQVVRGGALEGADPRVRGCSRGDRDRRGGAARPSIAAANA